MDGGARPWGLDLIHPRQGASALRAAPRVFLRSAKTRDLPPPTTARDDTRGRPIFVIRALSEGQSTSTSHHSSTLAWNCPHLTSRKHGERSVHHLMMNKNHLHVPDPR
jgi:hypothetical protein